MSKLLSAALKPADFDTVNKGLTQPRYWSVCGMRYGAACLPVSGDMRRLFKPIGWLAILGVIGTIATNGPAIADQSACQNLEAQLASVSSGSSNKQLRRYERAIISQQQQLERARNQQKNAGCSTLLSVIKPQCGSVRATVSKMERNLLSLQRTKNELSGGDGAPQEKSRILNAMRDNGCTGNAVRTAEQERPTGLFGRIFVGSDKAVKIIPDDERRGTPLGGSPRNYSAAPGNYRTVCVRTCDGYFFPIAYSSSPKLFDRDRQACEAMCPGTDVALYHHRVPDEETDAMVSSATGEPYAQLATAYNYRQPGYERAGSCQCNAPKNFSIIAGELPDQTEQSEPEEETVALPQPEARPDPAEDIETSANRDGGLDAAAIADLLAPKVATGPMPVSTETETVESVERPIRVVGPKFLPDPQAAIDLQAPGRTQLR